MKDISPDFRPNMFDSMAAKTLLEYEGTPRALVYFSEVNDRLTDYGYWFFLGVLWVSYTGWTALDHWKSLFSSSRPRRKTSIMKPSELKAFEALPYDITAYRAHRPGEVDWISYTLDLKTAIRFARERNVTRIMEYKIRKRDVIALFLRRDEHEILLLDRSQVKRVAGIDLVYVDTLGEQPKRGGN